MDDREVIAAMAAGDQTGIAVAYDKYAAGLYGYCHWILRQPDDAAEALRDTFVIATSMPDDLVEVPKLRPWLYSVARNECKRRLQTKPVMASDAGADLPGHDADVGQQDVAAEHPVDDASQPASGTDDTLQFRSIGFPAHTTHQQVSATDDTVQFRAIRVPVETTSQPARATDATLQFRAIGLPVETTSQPASATDATLLFRAINHPARTTHQQLGATSDLNGVNGGSEQAELRTLIRAILTELGPREREVVELNLRHDLYDTDLATTLGLSWSRAHALSSSARRQLEKALGAMLIARTGREACPALDELLTDWGGELNKQARDLVTEHIDHCMTCAGRRRGTLRPAALSSLLPLAPLPPELREQVLGLCSATTPDAVAYRRRIARRSEWVWLARFSNAIGWDSEVAAAVIVGLIWSAIAIGVALYLFVGYHPARAAVDPASSRTTASSPAIATTRAATIPASFASASPSPTVSQPAIVVLPSVTPSPVPTVPAEPPPSQSASPKPSKSASPKPSQSASPKPSASATPSSSASSPSPSPTG